jgi:O-acetyl-ADP-ribose deacetylase (regulator of RNase III)
MGEAAITRAGNLKSRFVIHAVGMHLGGRVSKESLRDATKSSLQRADEKRVRTIAFPAIGTGVGGFPVDGCAEIMIDTVSKHLKSEKTAIEIVYFVLFDKETFNVFTEYLRTKD